MTADEFRTLALSFPGVQEGTHMNHPDFRVNGKIFATLGPDLTWGMAKITPEQRTDLIARFPGVFEPVPGKWGEAGATRIVLAQAAHEPAGEALTCAFQNINARK